MNNNCASRLHRTLFTWTSVRPQEPALRGWLDVLGLEQTREARAFQQAAQRIQLLSDEVDILRTRLAVKGVHESLYDPVLRKVEESLSLSLLVQRCEHVRQYLTDDVFVGLGLCSALLPDEEDTISAEEFQTLVGIISELELLLLDEGLPTSLTALIRRHIRAAEMAIAQYPIRGAAALKDAVRFMAGNVMLDRDLIDQSLPPEQAEKLRSLVQRLNSVADSVIKVDNLLQIGSRAIKFLVDSPVP